MQTTANPRPTHARPVNPERAITRLRALQAQRWPLAELAVQLGYDAEIPFLVGSDLTADMDRRVTALFNKIGDRRGACADAETEARGMGYWPAIYYDDEMRLRREWIPQERRWATIRDSEEHYRLWLRIAAYSARGWDAQEIALAVGLDSTDPSKTCQRVREPIGLRLNPNVAWWNSSRVEPGQDLLLREIREHTQGIHLNEATKVVDQPGLDYEALWCSLCDVADLLHGAGEAGFPAANWPEPKSRVPLAATLTAQAA